jgi:hypothetical protein
MGTEDNSDMNMRGKIQIMNKGGSHCTASSDFKRDAADSRSSMTTNTPIQEIARTLRGGVIIINVS